MIEPKHVGVTLFGPYLIGVELASMLLLAALWGLITWVAKTPKTGDQVMELIPTRMVSCCRRPCSRWA